MPPKKTFIPAGLGERFKSFRADLGLNQSNMASLLGISQSMLSLVERGEAPMPFEAVCALLGRFPALDLRDLLLGDITNLMVDSRDSSARAAPVVKLAVASSAAGLIGDDYLAVPLLGDRLAVGDDCFSWAKARRLLLIHHRDLGARRRFVAIRVADEAMRPTIPAGAIVIVDLDERDPRRRQRHAWAIRANADGFLAVRRLQALKNRPGFMIVSDDFDNHPPQIAWTSDARELILGRVVRLWRSLD